MLPLDLKVTQSGFGFADHLRLTAAALYSLQLNRSDTVHSHVMGDRLMRLKFPRFYARFKCRFVGDSFRKFSLAVSRARAKWSGGGGGEMEGGRKVGGGYAGCVSRNGRKDKMLANNSPATS